MIDSFEVNRYRCFSSFAASNLSRINVIVGGSGTGKTALLEALWMCGGGNPQHYFNLLAWRGVLSQGEFQLDRESHDHFFREIFYRFDISKGADFRIEDSEKGVWTLQIGPDTDMKERLISPGSDSSTHTQLTFTSSAPGEDTLKVPISFSNTGKLQFPSSRRPYQIVFLNNVTLANPKNVASRFSQVVQDGNEEKIVAAIREVYKNISDLRLVSPVTGNVLLANIDGIGRLPISSVSGGINKYLTILTTLACSQHNVVLVDEVENGIYFTDLEKAWRGMLSACRESDSQLFLTTHSRECLNALAPVLEEHFQEFSLIRTETISGSILPVQFSGEEMLASLKQGFEIR